MISLIALFMAGGALGAMVVLVIGIHIDERRMGVKAKTQAGNRVQTGTRRVLGVGVRNVVSADRPDQHDVGR